MSVTFVILVFMFCTVIFGLRHVWIDSEKAQLAIKNKIVFLYSYIFIEPPSLTNGGATHSLLQSVI